MTDARDTFGRPTPGWAAPQGHWATPTQAEIDNQPLTVAAGRGAFVPLSRPKVIYIGDSLAVNPFATGDTTTGNIVLGDSAPTYAMLVSDGRWDHLGNKGIAGQRSDQILARLATDVIAAGANVCVLVSPGYMNDLFQSQTTDFSIANLTAMIVQLKAASVVPVLCTPTPDGTGSPTSPRNVWLYRMRRLVIALAAAQGVACVDLLTPLVDPTSGTLQSTYNVDGTVHPTPSAYVLMGQRIDAALRQIIPPSSDTLITDKGTGSPDLMGGAGLFYGTAVAGVAGGWTLTNTSGITASIVTDTAVLGNLQRMATAGSGSNGNVNKTITTGFTAGDVLEISGLVTLSAAGIKAEVQLFATGGTGSSVQIKPISVTPGGALTRGRFRKRFAVPPSTTGLTVFLKASGGPGTVDYGQIGLANLTAQALL